jgi:hypothetical protein
MPLDQSETKWLQAIDKKLGVIEAKLEVFADHETRIRQLEKTSYQVAVIISIVTAVLTATLTSLIASIL